MGISVVLPIANVMNSTAPKTRKQNLTSCLISIQSILNWEGKVVAPALDQFLNKVCTQNKAGGEKNYSRDWQITKRLQTNPLFNRNEGIGRIGVTAYILGIVGGYNLNFFLNQLSNGIYLPLIFSTSKINWLIFNLSGYFSLLSFFHFSEFFSTAIYKPRSTSYKNFVVNHSIAYTVASIAAMVEYFIELLLFPSLKREMYMVYVIGFLISVIGQGVRIVAMHTCQENFNHVVQEKQEEGHQLIKVGIYKYLRHPSYTGWFYWSVGTQVLLCNPICAIAYAYTSYNFFSIRIKEEESLLIQQYPMEYPAYKMQTYVFIPFIQ